MIFMEDNNLYVLDTSVFAQGYAALFSDKAIVTVYMVSEEVKSSGALIQFDMLMKSGLRILNPSDESLKVVRACSKKLDDNLSETDMYVVALALDFKERGKNVRVVSEDNSIKNLCKVKGIKVVSVKNPDIERTIRWVRKCVACGRKTDSSECPVCGSETKHFSRRV